MLQSLSIKNYALLADVEIVFGEGLNILTGETGAGKSIIIGALGTILGERVDTTVLRQGATKAVIEGRVSSDDNPALKNLLQEHDVAYENGELILRREIYDNARSRAFINDSPVQLSLMQAVGDALVDLHGQHEHQSLLKIQTHLGFLDAFANVKRELEEVAQAYQRLQTLRSGLAELEKKQKAFQEKKDYYQFQITEINKINPALEEEEILLAEERIVKNGERLFSRTSDLYQILYESENSVSEQLGRVEHGLDELKEIDEKFSSYKNDCVSARLTIEEISKFFQSYKSNINFNPDRLDEIQRRLAELSGLKKKYGLSIVEILKQREQFQQELENLGNLDAQMESLRDQFESEKKIFSELCGQLSARRTEAAARLEQIVPEVLQYLGMSNTRFKVALRYQDDPAGLVSLQGQTYYATASGMDVAEFMIAANKGEEVRPLNKVASGGEISRIMLALKSILASQGQIPILIFDEIDLGVSGRVAQAVGRKLKELSEFHQVICITHLPQIASMGNHHFSVEKVETKGRTETRIRKLSVEERTEAVAKLLAGERISETHLKSARELLQDAAAN